MPWRYDSDDDIIEIILEPNFGGDLLELVLRRVVYIVDSIGNKPVIDRLEADHALDRCLLERFDVADPNGPERNLLDILVTIDTHYYPYRGFVVHGAGPNPALRKALKERGILITVITNDGFVAMFSGNGPSYGLTALTEFLGKEVRG